MAVFPGAYHQKYAYIPVFLSLPLCLAYSEPICFIMLTAIGKVYESLSILFFYVTS
jgi:hypothetical protein